ncbi:tellurite resistance TerB family protein [Rhizobium sp. FKL33]|uniref:tellurite resistance TerB family protein n=1 Tax=Rhizobium sp. FKL33 TaxID=2562307 RepID=UPI0010BFB613|nr:tellurite resistance TerB family protein [Rhizobium sp. FKL33]
MFDAKKILDQFLGSNMPGVGGSVKDRAGQVTQMAKDNPLAAGAIAAVLLGTGTGRELTGSVLKLGGLAAIAGLGYQAYKNWQDGNQPQPVGGAPAPAQGQPAPELLPAPAGTGFSLEDHANNDDFALILVRAMISAARADGHIDDAERQAILGKVRLAGLDPDAEAFLSAELSNPVDLDAIIGAAKTESQKVELYTASRIAIDPDTRAERGYLDLLAGRLGLADGLIDHIEATVASAKVG